MSIRKEIENIRSEDSSEGLALMARKLGYRSRFGQLSFANGATASDLFEFFDDNPGAVEAVLTWVLDEGRTIDGEPLDDETEEEEECDDDEGFHPDEEDHTG